LETYSEDDGSDIVVEACSANGFLVGLGSTGLGGQNETGADPDSAGTEHESSGDTLSIEQATGSNDLNGLAGHRALVSLDQLDDSRDENCGGNITGVATTLASLGADDVNSEFKALLDMLGVADHVHVEHPVFVELLDNGLGGNTDGGNEELSAGLDDNVHKIVELSLGVVVAVCT
jgi:hypothetical protein